jgi:hypothetical protein
MHSSIPAAVLAAFMGTTLAVDAHISYSGRDFGSPVIDGPPVAITNQTVSSAFGWADATDDDWGDSHRGRFFRFTLTNTASIAITAERTTNGTGAAGTFLPAISLFAGLSHRGTNEGVWQETGTGPVYRVEALAHDGAELSTNSRPAQTEGSFRALTSWSIGNDPTYVQAGNPASGVLIPARLVTLNYIGHAADGTAGNYGSATGIQGDGNPDGRVTAHFDRLPEGNYSVFIGGADYAKQEAEPGPTFPTYGVAVHLRARSQTSYEAGMLDGVAQVTNQPASYNLYPASAIRDMHLGGLVIQASNGMAMLRLQLQTTSDLMNSESYMDHGDPVDVMIPMTDEASFIRVNARP